jgi:hypothetical protein
VLEVVSSRGLEDELLKEVLKSAVPHPMVRFFEKILGANPDEDIQLLAAARSQERSEKDREEIIRAMRELL